MSTSKIPYVGKTGDVTGVIGVAMDITDHKRAERVLERKTQLTAAINRVFRQAVTRESVEEVAQVALGVAEELTDSRFGFIGEINEDGKFDTIGISNPGWDSCEMEGSTAAMLVKGMELRGIWSNVVKSGTSQIINDPGGHPDRVGVPEGHPPLTAFLGVPLVREGRSVGMIALANREGGYDETDREIIEALAVPFYETLLRKRLEVQLREESHLKDARADLSQIMAGDQTVGQLCRNVITYLCDKLGMPLGLVYVAREDGMLQLTGSYAHQPKPSTSQEHKIGEGLVGQAALEQKEIMLSDVPEDYFTITSGLGETLPRGVFIKPLLDHDRLAAVLEFGFLGELEASHKRILDAVTEPVAIAIESARARDAQTMLLEETQRQSEELQSQQEELRVSNEELEEQTQRLKESEAQLKAQQELQVTNEELEEKTELLEGQKRGIERARREIAAKAEELALASRYKSEFLANMSHELRTPLNSLLLLSRSLMENNEGNLSADQVESARVIYQGGNELLSLINEILDLSKIEAGRMELRISEVLVAAVAESLRETFKPLAEEKGLEYEVVVEGNTPDRIRSDRKRVEQILKNLVGNALKFTQQGHVRVHFAPGDSGAAVQPRALDPGQCLSIAVADTGVGIPPEKHKTIFEAFQQVNGTSACRYGGTGLGLSIVKELTRLLGGEVQVQSEQGLGSTFTVFLPVPGAVAGSGPPPLDPFSATKDEAAVRTASVTTDDIVDDRDQIGESDRAILIIEDDLSFAELLARECREKGFKVLAASTGEAGVQLARRFLPQGLLLDLKLPGMDGWRVIELLKDDPTTRHIPVHIASVEEPSAEALRKGAIGQLQKPVTAEDIHVALKRLAETAERRMKRVLVVEDDAGTRRGLVELIADESIAVDESPSGEHALEALRANHYDCMVLDLGLCDTDGGELLERVEKECEIEAPPVIVYTGRELTWEEDLKLRSYSDAVIIKGVRSDERLLDEVSLFLHRVVADMPEKKRQMISQLHDADSLLRGKKVLIVDDDMRALFALTKLLSERGMHVLKAENGEKALAVLEKEPDTDIVLMDIMMPVLDGYETMKRIRAVEEFDRLPIIALTAKAMRGDQERCIEAGASDYLPKPVDQDRLISMLRVWLYR